MQDTFLTKFNFKGGFSSRPPLKIDFQNIDLPFFDDFLGSEIFKIDLFHLKNLNQLKLKLITNLEKSLSS